MKSRQYNFLNQESFIDTISQDDNFFISHLPERLNKCDVNSWKTTHFQRFSQNSNCSSQLVAFEHSLARSKHCVYVTKSKTSACGSKLAWRDFENNALLKHFLKDFVQFWRSTDHSDDMYFSFQDLYWHTEIRAETKFNHVIHTFLWVNKSCILVNLLLLNTPSLGANIAFI